MAETLNPTACAQVWKMSSADLCEIARNGVLHSGFPHACKKHWVAGEYWRPGPEGNDIQKTNVPNLRLRFRCAALGMGLGVWGLNLNPKPLDPKTLNPGP